MFIFPLLTAVWLWFTVSAGQQTALTHAKVVGGYPIKIDDVPYMVSVRLRAYHEIEFGLGHICGGTVISQRLVCSAAHCFAVNNTYPPMYRRAENYVVVGGGTKLDKLEGLTQTYLVETIVGHELYHHTTLENDIALLFLNDFIPWHYPTVRALTLARTPYPPGTKCHISGWGNADHVLQEAEVPVLNHRLCSFIYLFLPASQMCAGYLRGGVDACKGDSGGPLVCNGTLTGIISWGVDCGKPFLPGVYTNVSNYYDWIAMVNTSLDYTRYAVMRSLNGISGRYLFPWELYVILTAVLYWVKLCE